MFCHQSRYNLFDRMLGKGQNKNEKIENCFPRYLEMKVVVSRRKGTPGQFSLKTTPCTWPGEGAGTTI